MNMKLENMTPPDVICTAITSPTPCIKIVGGKRRLLPEILARVPQELHGYHEPFVGGGALFFELARLGRLSSRVVLSDKNPHLVHLYRTIRDDVEGLISALSPLRYDRDLYYQIRERLNSDEGSDAERAAWFILVNKTGYNGLWRVNKKGKYNVPFGSYKNPTICDADNLRACSAALQGADLYRHDFEYALEAARPGDFVYCDPPYVPLTATSDFVGYCADGFDMVDQVRLRDAAAEAKSRGVRVLLSNSSASAVFDLYREERGFRVELVEASRSVSCRASGRGKVKEVLIS
jgi:DNA adenine methylase